MCTAAAYMPKDLYFGRTLDYEFSYGETVTVTPRRFPLSFANGACLEKHYALIGMAHVADGYPLYYDAVNEKGLCMAGLNFVGNADKGIYYYKTYDRHAVVGVDMHRENLDGSALVSYPLLTDSGIEMQN